MLDLEVARASAQSIDLTSSSRERFCPEGVGRGVSRAESVDRFACASVAVVFNADGEGAHACLHLHCDEETSLVPDGEMSVNEGQSRSFYNKS